MRGRAADVMALGKRGSAIVEQFAWRELLRNICSGVQKRTVSL
jgi:hypothetical protein